MNRRNTIRTALLISTIIIIILIATSSVLIISHFNSGRAEKPTYSYYAKIRPDNIYQNYKVKIPIPLEISASGNVTLNIINGFENNLSLTGDIQEYSIIEIGEDYALEIYGKGRIEVSCKGEMLKETYFIFSTNIPSGVDDDKSNNYVYSSVSFPIYVDIECNTRCYYSNEFHNQNVIINGYLTEGWNILIGVYST